MAEKFKPGIPASFSLNVTPVQDLGDYLDEPPPTPRPQRKAVEPEPAAAVLAPAAEPQATGATPPPPSFVAPVEATPIPHAMPEPPKVPEAFPHVAEPANARDDADRLEKLSRQKAPRREISMTPETLRMSDELLDVIRAGSGQRDTKANELFHALVLLVHEVADEIDTHSIPKRGRWGTPTARAYPLELKNAFLKALLRKYAERGGDTIELSHPLGSAA